MKKKGLSILLSVCMVLTLLPLSLTASAAVQDKPTSIWVKNRDGTNTVDIMTSAPEEFPEGLSYDAATNTLTLDNVVITKDAGVYTYAGIIVDDSANLTICLKGNNIIKPTSDRAVYGIALEGDVSQQLVVTGDGSLVIDGPYLASIKTPGSLTIDSSVSLIAGFGGSALIKADGGITIGGDAYTGAAKEGAIVNGKVIDKVRKTALDLSAKSVSYGEEGAFNPAAESVTVEQTGESWGWNHETKTLTMSGAAIYSATGTYALRLPFESTIELTDDTENAVIGPDGNLVYAVTGQNFSIHGGGGLTALGGKSAETDTIGGASYAISCSDSLVISGSARVTAIGGIAGNVSRGLYAYNKLDISGSAHVRAGSSRSGSGIGIAQTAGEGIFISENAYVETDTSNTAGSATGIQIEAGNLEISGGTVKTLQNKTLGIDISNLYDETKGNVRITGGTVEVSGNQYGLRATRGVAVTGGSLTVSSSNTALETENGTVTAAPASKRLGVYAGDAVPGTKFALVTAPETLTLTSEQAANKYVRIAYEPALGKDADVKAQYIPGGDMETVYSVDVSWGAMEFTYSPGNEGVWNPDTHQVEGVHPAGWQHAQGANQVRVVNHSNTAVDVKFAFAADPGFETVIGAFDKPSEVLATAMNTDPNAAPSVTSALTLSGELSDRAAAMTKIGTVTVTIDAAE